MKKKNVKYEKGLWFSKTNKKYKFTKEKNVIVRIEQRLKLTSTHQRIVAVMRTSAT